MKTEEIVPPELEQLSFRIELVTWSPNNHTARLVLCSQSWRSFFQNRSPEQQPENFYFEKKEIQSRKVAESF